MFAFYKKSTLALLVAAFSLFSTLGYSQCGPLSTPSVTNNGQSGIMFDIVALQSVNITQMGMDFDAGSYNIEIYYIGGTHVGNETNAGAWTLLGTANGWNSTAGSNVIIPIAFSQFLCAGDVGAFYVTASNGTGGNYSNGTGVGNVAAADANIQILEGTGKAYPFGTSFTPRVPNVTVYYDCAISCCLPPTMSMTQETCVGSCDGTATATVGAGGIAPYTYQWDAAAGGQTTQTATGLCAGSYTVDVTDATGCISTGTIIVTSGAATANATITPVGPYCVNDASVFLTGADPGGTWSGNGIIDPATGEFDPWAAGAGTHTITYTIAGPCGDIQTTDIVINPQLNATITPAGPFCELEGLQWLTAVDAGGTWSGNGITNGATGEFDPGTAGPGTHTITYWIAGSCGDTQTADIIVDPQLDATITPAGPYCAAEPAVTLTAATAGGTWSGNGITNAATGQFDPAVAGAGVHTITYTIPGVCGDSQTTDITVNAIFDATITPAGPFCELEGTQWLTAVDPGGTWTGSGITNAATGAFDPGTAGPGTHTITYTIGGPCGDSQTTDIIIDPQLNATITPVGPYCVGDLPVTLTAVDPGGTWTGNGITNAATGDFDPATAGIGTHTITYTIAGVCGDVQTTDIIVNSAFDATITPAGPYCTSSAATNLTAVDPGGTWSGNGITDPVAGTFDPAVAGVGTHTITYMIAGSCGDTQTEDIIVDPQLNATITPAGPYCTIDPVVWLTAVDPGGTWVGNGITNAATGAFDPALAGAGTHTITYALGGMCGDVQTTNIVVNSAMDATITPVGPFCADEPQLTLTAVDAGGTWSGIGITDPIAGTFDPATAGPGTHTITYMIGGSCGDMQTEDIVVNALDDATITPAGPFCLGGGTTLNAVTPGGTWTGAGITNASTGTFDASSAGPGTHTITYSTNGPCPDVQTVVLVVADPLTIQAFSNTTICDGESVNLTATASGGDGNLTITWFDESASVVGTGGALTVSPSITTTYTAAVTDGCSTPPVTSSVTITVNPIPTVNFDVSNALGCAPLEVTFTNLSSPIGTNCTWDYGTGESDAVCGTTTYEYLNPGCFDVTLNVTANNCSNSYTMVDAVCITDQPVADFSASPFETDILNTEVDFYNQSIYADNYEWSFGDGVQSYDVSPTHIYSEEPAGYIVCLTAANNYGCYDSVCKLVTVNDLLLIFVPNSFTPNGDQFNQNFQPVFASGFDPYDFNFLIFNRWGEIVWESNDASVAWDGTYNGKLVESGTYVWKASFKSSLNDARKVVTGSVNVLR